MGLPREGHSWGLARISRPWAALLPEGASCQMARIVHGEVCANVYSDRNTPHSGLSSAQGFGESGNSNDTSCPLDRLQSTDLARGPWLPEF